MSEIHTPTPSQPSLTWALIGQAYAPVSIPPKGYGAVESIIWDYKTYLQQLGHRVVVINTGDKRAIIDAVNRCRPDVVHLHQYPLSGVLNKIRAPVKIFTSHSGYEISRLASYRLIAKHFIPYLKDGLFIFVLSPVWRRRFIDCGYHPAEVFVTLNGADHRRFQFRNSPLHANRGIYLGNITGNKRQHLYQTIDSIDFAGPHGDARFEQTRANYLGEWTREYLYAHLSDYANLVILSRVEAAAPLVVLEALVCGLGVVVSEAASVNLDTKLPWVTVIPEQKITDIDFVTGEIARNRAIALRHREAIRQYGIDNFSWEKLIPRYADLCAKLRAESPHNRPPPAKTAQYAAPAALSPAGVAGRFRAGRRLSDFQMAAARTATVAHISRRRILAEQVQIPARHFCPKRAWACLFSRLRRSHRGGWWSARRIAQRPNRAKTCTIRRNFVLKFGMKSVQIRLVKVIMPIQYSANG